MPGPKSLPERDGGGVPAGDMTRFRVPLKPNYIHHGSEEELFRHARAKKIPLIIKGPTGCGKTRFVEYMAHALELPLFTVSCHEDLSAADLTGRFLFTGGETRWQDGPLTLAARHGGICYLDEIVEARKDTTVVIHSLTDDRRTLYIDKTGEVVRAHADFLMVLSYNPGYQNIAKDLKHSTRQRFISLDFDHPGTEQETAIIVSESGIDEDTAQRLAGLAEKIRGLEGYGLEEGVSCRLMVYAGRLMAAGARPRAALRAAVVDALTEDREMALTLEELCAVFFPEGDDGGGG